MKHLEHTTAADNTGATESQRRTESAVFSVFTKERE